MKSIVSEDDLEKEYISTLENLGYEYKYGKFLLDGLRETTSDVIFISVLREAINKISKNNLIPDEFKEEAIKKVLYLGEPVLLKANETFHKMLVEGVPISPYTDLNGNKFEGGNVLLFDFENPENNNFMVVNQFTVVERDNRRPDIILFVNGLPLVLIELKSLADERAGLKEAFNQVSHYQHLIPSVFRYNAFIVLGDGVNAKVGTITSSLERFMNFKSIDGINISKNSKLMESLCHGVFAKDRILEIIREYILFYDDEKENGKIKILAQYQQYYAVKKALEKTREAKNNHGKIGVVWHTQGSGKSFTMVFYTGQLMKKFDNPTILVVTDRNDLDDQLYKTFSCASSYLVENPKQVKEKDNLKEFLDVASGGIIFSTMQKFSPAKDSNKVEVISMRDDIIIIADEAHRSHYGFSAKMDKEGNIKYGFAKYLRDALPNANFIGFTGTPIDFAEKSTEAVFGNLIDTYDMTQAVDDGATVKIYYENRFVELGFDFAGDIDEEFENIMEGQEEFFIKKQKDEFTRIEAVIGSPQRIKELAKDFVSHWEKRKNFAFGKAMFVCMSRRICVALHDEIKKLRPEWFSADQSKGKVKVIMTSDITKDPVEWKEHFTTKDEREKLAHRMKNVNDELEIAIVRDMWLTGFDVPCLHTIYIDKFIQGHSLMQAIARVNRVFRDKSGGLVVDYHGIGNSLKEAMQKYSASDRNMAGIDIKVALSILQENIEKLREIFHSFDYSNYNTESKNILSSLILDGMEFLLELDNKNSGTKEKFLDGVISVQKAYAICSTHPKAKDYNLEVAYFKAVKSSLEKIKVDTEKVFLTQKEINDKLSSMVANTIIAEQAIDIYESLGIDKPDISILSDEFLNDLKNKKQKNLAIDILSKLLEGKIKYSAKKNFVMSKKFSEKLIESLNNYKNKIITSYEMMEKLIAMAKEFQNMNDENKKLGLSEEEIAFYDAITFYDGAKQAFEDATLKLIAKELTETIRKNKTIDWISKESVQAQMRLSIKKLLAKYKYPPDKTPEAIDIVLKQAKLMCEEMSD